jgi:hypothetical protein
MDAARLSPTAVRAALRERRTRARRRAESAAAVAERVRVVATGGARRTPEPRS